MRAGSCTVQQALTPEATAVVKQAVSLARRRGNPQVTPLHVASAMLQQQQGSSSMGLLRAACLRSHSHPLQCKALELCFNVALNRLPASLLGHGHVYYPPSLSNALVAAFKRAQAHQRRGSAGADNQQQQAVVAVVKVELEQLVISILDDPSVSRVMREAGFSSTQVKASVEQAQAVVVSSSSVEGNSPPGPQQSPNDVSAVSATQHQAEETKPSSKLLLPPNDQAQMGEDDDDVRAILDCMASRRKRRFMVVTENSATAESAARTAIDRIRSGEAMGMRGVQVVSLRVSTFRDAPRDDAERLLADLRRAVRAAGGRAGGVVVFVEDMAWAAEFTAGMWRSASTCCGGYYSAAERAVAEVRALACLDGDGVWLVGHGTYKSYMRCRAGRPSLEMLWELQTLAVPAGSLALSLNLNCLDVDSALVLNHHSIKSAKCDDDGSKNGSSRCLSLLEAGSSGQLTAASSTFCGDFSAATKCEMVMPLPRSVVRSSSNIPHWLQHLRDEELHHSKKWSSSTPCGGSPSQRTTLNLSTAMSPSSSVSFYEKKNYHLHQSSYQPWLLADVDDAKYQAWKAKYGAQIHVIDDAKHQAWKAKYGGQIHDIDDEDVKLLKVKSHDSSASDGSSAENEVQCQSRFKEISAENLKALCSALEKEVPWQADVVPEIASTVLRCRSGMERRRRDADASTLPAPVAKKEDTWLFFLGGDAEGKVRVARELARLVFGSRKRFVSIGAAPSSSSPAAHSDSTEQQQQGNGKRPRSAAASCIERLHEAVRDDPRRVIMVEDVEQADRRCHQAIVEAIESGLVRSHGGDEAAALGDAIVVLSCESFDAKSRASSPPVSKKAKLESEDYDKDDEISTGDDHRHNKEAVAAGATSTSAASSFDLNMSVENDDVEDSCRFTDAAGLLKAVNRAFFFRRLDETSD